MQPGDIITRINDQQVGKGFWGVQEIAESRPGDKVSIQYLRQGRLQTIEVVLASQPLAQSETSVPSKKVPVKSVSPKVAADYLLPPASP